LILKRASFRLLQKICADDAKFCLLFARSNGSAEDERMHRRRIRSPMSLPLNSIRRRQAAISQTLVAGFGWRASLPATPLRFPENFLQESKSRAFKKR
jgi:hypothetical protein